MQIPCTNPSHALVYKSIKTCLLNDIWILFVSVGRWIEQFNILSAGIVRSIKRSLDANLFSRYFWFFTECDRPSSGNWIYFRAVCLHCRGPRVVSKSQQLTNFPHNSRKFCWLLSQETKVALPKRLQDAFSGITISEVARSRIPLEDTSFESTANHLEKKVILEV